MVLRRAPALRRAFWKTTYQYLATRFSSPEFVFMNYGYAPPDGTGPLALDPVDEPDRLFVQLYDHVVAGTDLRGRDVLEVGCGRGGGSSYIHRYRHPRTVVGVDRSSGNIAFCRRRHPLPGLTFLTADAERLPFGDGSFDAVVNVESSHCYGSMTGFLEEAWRILRPGGRLLYADFRGTEDLPALRRDLAVSGFICQRENAITNGVLAALERDSERRRMLIERYIPRVGHGIFMTFAGVRGTSVYEAFRLGRREYLSAVLQKPLTPQGT